MYSLKFLFGKYLSAKLTISGLTKETSEHHGSTIQWRGRANAASTASDIPSSQRDRKKVSKDERRAMLESYVNKYSS